MIIITILIKFLLTLALSIITLIHLYWLLGGRKGLDAALPHNISTIEKNLSNVSIISLNIYMLFPIIGVFSLLLLSLYDVISVPYKNGIHLVFSLVFITRGLTGWIINRFSNKEIFRKNNNKIYSPTTLLIGIFLLFLYYQDPG